MNEISSVWQLIEKYGLGVALSIGVFALAWVMMKHVLSHSSSILNLYQQDRDNWNLTVNNHISTNTKALDKVCEKLEKHENEATTSRAYVRKEHEQMIKSQQQMVEVLTRVNGNTKK